MEKRQYVFPMRITKLNEYDYYIDSPVEGINISGGFSSLGEAVEEAKNSLEFTLFDMIENNEEIPTVEEKELLNYENKKEKNEYITFIVTNEESIYKKYGNKPVKKMVSIPSYQEYWLNERNISVSKFLRENIDREIKK